MLELLVILLVILALVVLNGLFVASEFAIISASRAALANQARQGDLLAKRASLILANPAHLDRYIATAQLGITFASLGLGMYGEHNLARLLDGWLAGIGVPVTDAAVTSHAIATLIALTFVTYLHVVFGEMIPKSLALTHALTTVHWVLRPMTFIGWLMNPLVRGLTGIGNVLLRQIGFHRSRGASHYYEPEELETLVRESRRGGLMAEEGERIFREIIDFSEITAGEAMIPRVWVDGIPVDSDCQQLREIISASPRTRYPVFDGSQDQIIGTVHIKDLLTLLGTGADLPRDRIHEVAHVPRNASLEQVLAVMDRIHNQMVIVMDEHGGTAGILTIEDICAEAIGEVEEGLEDLPDIVELGPERLQVQGTVRLDTLGAAVSRDLEHPDVITVSGLILALLGRPARRGDSVRWRGFEFQVKLLHGRGVEVAVVLRPQAASAPGRRPE